MEISGRTEDLHGDHKGYFFAQSVDFELRDLFAAFALTLGEGVWPGGRLPENAEAVAKNAYAVADAMLAQREEK